MNDSLFDVGKTIIERRGSWLGTWSWPLTVGVLPGRSAANLTDQIGGLDLFRYGLGDVGVLGRDFESCDLLLLTDYPAHEDIGQLMRQAKAVFIGNENISQKGLDKRLRKMRREFDLGAMASAPLSREELPDLIGGLLANLSHDYSFEHALDAATTQPVTTVATPEFLEAASARGALFQLAERSKGLGAGFSVSIPESVRRSLNIGTTAVEASALPDMLRDQVPGARFDSESQGGLGTLTMGKRVDDIVSGPSERSADFLIHHRNGDDSIGTTVGEYETLTPGDYLLEVALRTLRHGIGFEGKRDPVGITTSTGACIMVAVAVDDLAIDLTETVLSIDLPPEGDSTTKCFPFTLAEHCQIATFDIRFYFNLNLLEHIQLQIHIEASPPGTLPRMVVMQPITFERFTGDLADTCPPCALSIDVSRKGEQYQLVLAVPDIKSVKLVTHPGMAGADLAAAILKMRELWLRIALDTFKTGLDARLKAFASADLFDLAKAGRAMWSMLFEMGLDSGRTVGDALAAMNLSKGAKIQISLDESAQTFFFPWALLYDGMPPRSGQDVDINRFWGARLDIEQTVQRRKFRPPHQNGARSVALFLNTSITQAKAQSEALEALGKTPGAKASVALPPIESRADFETRLREGNDDLLYFYCHGFASLPASPLRDALRQSAEAATSKADRPAWFEPLFGSAKIESDDSAIQLTSDMLKLSELWALPTNPNGISPIVILNMCESAQLFPDVGSSFIKFFLNRPSRAVLGTECPVPPEFAADFGEKLMGKLLSGEPIGTALRDLRADYLSKHRNPLGLAYSLWGSSVASLN